MTATNPFTGESRFEIRDHPGARVNLIFQFRRHRLFSIIPMQWHRDRWIARLFLLPGRYAYAIEVDGNIRVSGIAEIKTDYRDLTESTLRLLAVTHTCFCHPHKWN